VYYAIAGLEIGFHYTEMRLKSQLYLVGPSSMLDDACFSFILFFAARFVGESYWHSR
jgi:hypothetical protein